MGKYELTKTDYEILENLLDVSKQIRFQYTSLMSLEIDNKKNTNEYQLLLQRLYELLSFEKRCYDSISNNPDKVDAFIKYFNTEDNLNDFFEEIHIMIDGKDCDLIKYRIIIRTLAIKTNINQKKLYDFGNEVKEEIKELDINLPEEINNSYFDLANLIELAKMLKQDFLNTLLSLANIDFQIKIKYLIAFLYNAFEEEITKNNFNDEMNICWISKATSEIKGIPKAVYDEAKKRFGYDLILEIMNYLKENETYNELWNLLVRTSLLFCSETEKLEIKNKFNQLTKDLLIKNDQDKSLLLILSLKGI